MSRVSAAAAAAFRDTLDDLGVDDVDGELGDPVAFGRRAALVATADVLWRRHLGPCFDTRHVQELLGGRTRQAVSDLVKRRRLLALETREGHLAFPSFQFSITGRPYPTINAILELFEPSGADAYTVASWCLTPKALLEGKTPAEWLRDGREPALVLEAARRSAARLSH